MQEFDNEDATDTAFPGVYRAVVTNINDPLHQNRVRVKCPALNGDDELDWALPVSVDFGRPHVGAAIWVMFEHGHIDHPVYLGSWLESFR